jgi:hypothetical protein
LSTVLDSSDSDEVVGSQSSKVRRKVSFDMALQTVGYLPLPIKQQNGNAGGQGQSQNKGKGRPDERSQMGDTDVGKEGGESNDSEDSLDDDGEEKKEVCLF